RLILVLAATGHQAEALDVYRNIRARLAGDLGVDPGAELQAAQQEVLSQTVPMGNPTPTWGAGPGDSHCSDGINVGPASAARPDDTASVRPAQLPTDLPVFTGRCKELEGLRALLPTAGGVASSVVISAIGGMAGVGKTTLAVHWAHQVAERFPDGQLYVNLRGFHPSDSVMSAAEAMRSFLDALGVPSHRLPAGLEAQAALYRSLLADRRMLILLDNAHDTEHVRPLLPGASGCLVIVTSRNQLCGLVAGEGAHSVTLDLLSEAEALAFLRRRLGADRVTREPSAAAEIVSACGNLPLALAIVSARATINPAFTLASVAAELRESGGSLDAFSGEAPVTDARTAFSWSYNRLSPEAARVFRLLALHPGPDSSLEAVASLAGQRPGQIRPLLAELARAHLIFEAVPGRFGCHELLRTYAAELGRTQDASDERGPARRRMLDHYLHSAHAAERILAPSREHWEPMPHAAEVTVQRFADQAQAAAWLDVNRPVLLAVIEQGTRHGSGEHSWLLAAILERYLDRGGRWQEQVVVQTTAMTAARCLGDVRGQAYAHRALGFANGRLGHWKEAGEHLARALKLFGEIGDPAGQGRVHRYFAFLANVRLRHDEALDHYRRASGLYRTVGRRSEEASVFNEVGWTYILMGEYAKALDECGQALALHREIGDRNGEAAAWDSLGYAHHHLRDHNQALACYEPALELYRAIRDRYLEADTLVHIGDSHHAAGHRVQAAFAWRQALAILDEIGHPDAAGVRDRLKGAAVSGRQGNALKA
ncbi:NB-ARC domain-containing protein, partial [Streptomyces sp. NPDC020362]